jgi:hypothetical protein
MSDEVTETDNPITDEDLARLGSAVRDPDEFVGRPLKFAKGQWTIDMGKGNPEVKIGADERWIVDCRSYANGYVKWIDRRPLVKAVFRSIDGWIMPPRENLPDRDESRWPWDSKLGKGKDPWQETHKIVCKRVERGELDDGLVTWTTTSYYGLKAMQKIVDTFVGAARKHPGMMPVVTLDTTTRHTSFGEVEAPMLTIVDWHPFGDGASPPGQRNAIPQSAAMLMFRQPEMVAIAAPDNTIDAEVIENKKPLRRADCDDEIPF